MVAGPVQGQELHLDLLEAVAGLRMGAKSVQELQYLVYLALPGVVVYCDPALEQEPE